MTTSKCRSETRESAYFRWIALFPAAIGLEQRLARVTKLSIVGEQLPYIADTELLSSAIKEPVS